MPHLIKTLILLFIFLLFACSSDDAAENKDEPTITTITSEGSESNNEPEESEEVITLTCSSTYKLNIASATNITSNDGNASFLIDNIGTDVSSWNSTGSEHIVELSLDSPALLKHLVIHWLNTGVQNNYEISVSQNKTDWTAVTVLGKSIKDDFTPTLINLNGSETTARYIQFKVQGNDLNESNSVIEFEAFGCQEETELVTHNINLDDWYVTIPTDDDSNGKSDNIYQEELLDGYFDPRFFYTSKDGGLVFKTLVAGYKTSENTKYVRTELREMLRKDDDDIDTQGVNGNNWVFSSAPVSDLNNAGGIDGTLDVTIAVNAVTTTGDDYQKGRVIIGQIHANDDEPARLYYRKLPNNLLGSIYLAHEPIDKSDVYYELVGSRSDDASNPTDGIALGERFSYQIKVEGNLMTITIFRENKPDVVQTVEMSNSGYDDGGQYMYFKAGVYNQNNSGDTNDFVEVTIYDITNTHTGYDDE